MNSFATVGRVEVVAGGAPSSGNLVRKKCPNAECWEKWRAEGSKPDKKPIFLPDYPESICPYCGCQLVNKQPF